MHPADAEVTVGACAGKQPGPRPIATPVSAQFLQQPGREGHEAILGTLALAHHHESPGGVDVFQAQGDQLAEAQAQGIVLQRYAFIDAICSLFVSPYCTTISETEPRFIVMRSSV